MSKKNNKADVEAAKDMSAPLNEQVVEQYLTPNPLSKFSMDTDALRLALVTAQFALRATRQPVVPSTDKAVGLLVLVNGMEQAGKGTAVTQLRQWIDPRLLKVEATIGDSPLAHQPIWQVHIKAIPRHGDVMVYFGNWYADLIYNVMRMATETEDNKKSAKNTQGKDTKALPIGPWQAYLRQHLIQLQDFEQDLAANQTKLLKCWFHVDIEILQARLNDDEPAPKFLYQIDWHDAAIVDKFNEVAVSLLRQQGDWVIIDCADKSQVARHFCHEVLHAMQKALVSSHIENNEEVTHVQDAAVSYHDKSKHKVIGFEAVKIPKLLTDIDKSDIDKSDYHKALAKKQARLAELLRARQGRHVVFAFEGMDAAGKGGTIKRLVAPLDPREYQIYNISAPMLHELQHPYLWRFWTKLPNEQTDRISRIAIFDRTWYGRVLVERIEGFATEDEWQRAYDEINRFEADLAASGILVIKYWLAIDKKEQLKRFEAREETAHKQFKLTDDDWRNRDKWSDYVQSAADMLARTDSRNAPWCVIVTNDKRQARLDVLDHAIERLSTWVSGD